MKILPNANELLRAALTGLSNEDRLALYKQRKALYEAQKGLQAYLDKVAAPGSSEPDWWTYEDNDSEWIKQHEPGGDS